MELLLMRLEYFNQWYSLCSYYTCVTLMDLPIQVCISLFNFNYSSRFAVIHFKYLVSEKHYSLKIK